jgi:hypothetical protein
VVPQSLCGFDDDLVVDLALEEIEAQVIEESIGFAKDLLGETLPSSL